MFCSRRGAGFDFATGPRPPVGAFEDRAKKAGKRKKKGEKRREKKRRNGKMYGSGPSMADMASMGPEAY